MHDRFLGLGGNFVDVDTSGVDTDTVANALVSMSNMAGDRTAGDQTISVDVPVVFAVCQEVGVLTCRCVVFFDCFTFHCIQVGVVFTFHLGNSQHQGRTNGRLRFEDWLEVVGGLDGVTCFLDVLVVV